MRTLFAAISTLFCASLASLAEMVVLTPSADTTLFQTFPDNNLGGVTTLAAGTTAHGFLSRALIKFEVAGGMPTNVVITSARLRLNVERTPFVTQPSTFLLHRVLKDWGEGDKSASTLGELAAPGQATWNNRFYPSTPWQTPGGGTSVDFSSAVSSFSTNSNVGPSLFETSAAMVADVQNWMTNPSQNFGWIVISDSEGTALTARRFGSREDPNNTPLLEIDYAPPFRINSAALADATFRFSFTVEPLFSYTVQSRASLSTGSWTLLTNFTETISSYEATISDISNGPSRLYRVLKLPCNCQ